MITQDEFLKLKPDEARAAIEAKPQDERSGWAYLYEARHGVALYAKEEPTPANEGEESTSWVVFGYILVLAGAALAGWSFLFDVGVDAPGAYPLGIDRVANADRMAIREMILQVGSTLFLSGWIMVLGGAVLKAIGDRH